MWYVAFIGLIALARLIELKLANHNLKNAEGSARLAPDPVYPTMVIFHTLWLFACIAEVLLLQRPFIDWIGWPMMLAWCVVFVFRLWVLKVMRGVWNTRIVEYAKPKVVTTGPYQYMRHPNYLVVILEILIIPLIHSAWITALVGSLVNAIILRQRLKYEEAYLETIPEYRLKMMHKPRFFPWF